MYFRKHLDQEKEEEPMPIDDPIDPIVIPETVEEDVDEGDDMFSRL